MSSSEPQDKENVHALELCLKVLSLSPNVSKKDSSKKHGERGIAELAPSLLSLSQCNKSDIVKTLNMKTKTPTVIKLNNIHLLKNSSTNIELKEEPEEGSIDFVKLFAELTVSSVCSTDVTETEEESQTIQKRGKCPVKHSSSQPANHLPYPVNHRQRNESPQNNLLHLSGGSVQCYSLTDETSDAVNIVDTEVTSQYSLPSMSPEGSCLSPESGYGSPNTLSSRGTPSATSFAEPLDLYATSLESVLNIQERIPDEEKNDVLDDIMQLISKENKDPGCSCQTVTLIQPIYILPLMTCLPKKKQPRTILPKLPNTDTTERFARRDLLKCHLNTKDMHQIAKSIYLRKREDKKKRIIFIEDSKTKRTNLHTAVIKQELEHVYCLVEIQIQFSQDWKNVAIAFNLEDTFHKTALDYAKEATMEQKSSLIAYLEKSGAKSKLKKQS